MDTLKLVNLQLFSDEGDGGNSGEYQGDLEGAVEGGQIDSGDSTGGDPTGGQQQTGSGKVFTQEDVDRIVEQRLARERRRFEREARRLRERIEALGGQLPVTQQLNSGGQNPEQLDTRQFLQQFSRDPQGTLRRFAQGFTQEQLTVQQRAQNAARDAVEEMSDRYEDWNEVAHEVMQHIQRSPVLANYIRSRGPNVTAEDYEAVLEEAYHAVKARRVDQASMAGRVQQTKEEQAVEQSKRQAAGPRQRTSSQQMSGGRSPEDILFEAMKRAGRRI